MFGIVSTKNTCSKDSGFRNNYCGTCKTIAFEYGHSFRMALNFDVVFLSELYDALTFSDPDYSKISNFNCFSIPKDKKYFPHNLKYAAAVNILLSKYKIEDNIQDNKNKIVWKFLKNSTKSKIQKAEFFLKNQKVNIEKIEKNILSQFKLEKENNKNVSLDNLFVKYTEQTSNITSEIFKGIIKENEEVKRIFEKIGSVFGQIVYLTDAIKDIDKDYKNNAFNVLTINPRNLNENKKHCEEFVNKKIDLLLNLINQLPINNDKKVYFKNRITTLYFTNIVKKSDKIKVKLKERVILSLKSAKHLSQKFKYLTPKYSVYSTSIILFVIITLLFPNVVFALGTTSAEHGCCSDTCHCCCDCCCCGDYDESCTPCTHGTPDFARGLGEKCDVFYKQQGCKGCIGLGCCCGLISCFSGLGSGAGNVTKVIIIKEVPSCGKC